MAMENSNASEVEAWTAEKLMGDVQSSKKKKNALEWGFPGQLTQEEVNIYFRFRDEVAKRGGEFRNTVFSFSETEGEAYTLTRWLRARKYKYDDVIQMVEEATECRAEARDQDYYPDPVAALGVDPAIYISQYPQLYTGFAKNGCPIFISKPGLLNIDGIECITTLEGILKYHWHVMQHDYLHRLLAYKKENPAFVRFESVSILDLSGLAASSLNNRTLSVIKKQSFIDSLCFPETMNKMIIVNSPTFFAVTWKLIKGWLDVRTANKVEVISSKKAMYKRLLELVDEDQLPSDYGGKAEDTMTTMNKNISGDRTRIVTEMMSVRNKSSFVLDLSAGEEAEIVVYTNGTTGAKFAVYDQAKNPIIEGVDVAHDSAKTIPVGVSLTKSRLSGFMKIKAETNGSRFSSENFLVVCNIFSK